MRSAAGAEPPAGAAAGTAAVAAADKHKARGARIVLRRIMRLSHRGEA
jgi:hypothetical protein